MKHDEQGNLDVTLSPNQTIKVNVGNIDIYITYTGSETALIKAYNPDDKHLWKHIFSKNLYFHDFEIIKL